MSSPEQPLIYNSLEVLRPFIDAVQNDTDVQIMGGVGTAALEDPRTEINMDKKEVYAPTGFALPTFRDNGTRRDVDVLLTSSNSGRIAEVEAVLEATVGEHLQREVFPIRPHEVLADQILHPFGRQAILAAVSDRYEASPDIEGVFVKALFPYAVEIDPETLEPWTLVTDLGEFPIPHPGTTVANYTNRSITGLRHKDTRKMNLAAHNIFTNEPEMREWLIDGPGKSQLELSTIIASLRRPNRRNLKLISDLKIDTYSDAELLEHDNFLRPDLSRPEKMGALALARLKVGVIKPFEDMDGFVAWWQRHMEQRAAAIVKNK